MVHENRRRYIVFHVISPSDIGKGLVIKLTRERTRSLSPDDFNMIKPWFVYYRNQWGIVRTGHRGCGRLVDKLTSLDGTQLREGMLKVRVVGVSGTLRGAFYKHIPEKARENLHYRTGD